MTTKFHGDEYLSPKEMKELTGISVKSLANWRSSGKVRLPYIKVGGKILYSRSGAAEYFDAHTVTSTAQARLLPD